jgi:alpha-aminoadipic semialdehyde synthase
MIETLCCLGQRLKAKGTTTPLAEVKHAHEYGTLEKAEEHLRQIGKRIEEGGLDESLRPLVFGIAGYGNVSRGCQEILSCLPVKEVAPADLSKAAVRAGAASPPILKVVFKEEDLVRPALPGAKFELQDYYDHPEKYVGCFEDYLPHLDVLLNTTYWDERYPRFVTKKWVKENYGPDRKSRLKVIGDISCDIGGAIELTAQPTTPDAPSYTYEPATDSIRWGCDGIGPAIMAVDNLPCELPREASTYFSRMLRGMVAPLTQADWDADFAQLNLPEELKGAVILHRGELTPPYRYLEQYLAS